MATHQVAFVIRYTPDEGGYCAVEPVTGTTSWGKDLAEAKAMITEALELYFDEVSADEARAVMRDVVDVAVPC